MENDISYKNDNHFGPNEYLILSENLLMTIIQCF